MIEKEKKISCFLLLVLVVLLFVHMEAAIVYIDTKVIF